MPDPTGNTGNTGNTAAAAGSKVTASIGQPKPPARRDYLVFEVPAAKLTPGEEAKFIGTFEAESKLEARWAAVEATDGMQARVEVEEGKEGGVFMVAVAASNAQPELTREDVVKSKVRR